MLFYHWLLILLLALSFGCIKKQSDLVFEGSLSGNGNANSVVAFSQTVYPIVQQNCVKCHTSTMSPFFAHPDVTQAHSNVLTAFKVDLNAPANSRLYQRLKDDLHNCWGDCSSNAQEMLSAIKLWAAKTKNARKLIGIQTESKLFSSAKTELSVLQDLTIYEAEDAVASGRMSLISNQSASGLKAMTTPKVANHPVGSLSTRYGEMTTGCRTDIALSEYSLPSANRPYRIYNKLPRHPDPNGYRPYYLNLNVLIIRPDRRVAYVEELKTKGSLTLQELEPFIWKNLGFTLGNPNNNMYGSSILGESQSFGKPIGNASPVFLPDGLSLEEYDAKVLAGTLSADYFAPRFNGAYYSANGQEIRKQFNRLQISQQFISKAIYAPVAQAILNWLHTNANVPKDSVALDTNGTRQFLSDNTLTGVDAFNDLFTLNYNDAGNVIYQSGDNIIHEIDKYVYIEAKEADIVYKGNLNRDVRFVASAPLVKSIYDTLLESSGITPLPWVAINPLLTQPYDIANVLYPTTEMEKTLESYNVSKFTELIHPVLTSPTNSCINCHSGQASTAPAFSVVNSKASYDVVKDLGGFKLHDPSSSGLYRKMLSNHSATNKCGTNAACNALATSFLNKITAWAQAYNDEKTTLTGQSTFLKSFTVMEQTPGMLKLKFTVKEAGKFKFLARLKHSGPDIDRFDPTDPPFIRYNLINASNTPVPMTQVVSSVETLETDSCNKNDLVYAYGNYLYYIPDEVRSWKWVDSGSKYYSLLPGEYTLQVFEGRDGVEFDQVGFSKNLALQPNPATLASTSPLVSKLEFDVSNQTGIPNAKFVMSVADYYGFYKITNPHFISTEGIWVKDIQIMVNGFANPNDSTFRNIVKLIPANSTASLSSGALLVFQQNGTTKDKLSVLFQELRKAQTTDAINLITDTRDGQRICRDQDFFEKNIFPLFTSLQIWPMRNDPTYYEMLLTANYDQNRNSVFHRNGFLNTCTGCHATTVPVFKMNPTNVTELCLEIIKRVNFDDPESSTILRGINTQFGHARIHIPEKPVLEIDGSWKDNPDSWNGKASEWLTGTQFKTYADYEDLFNPSGPCTSANVTDPADIAYLKKFIGTHKRVQMDMIETGPFSYSFYTNYDRAEIAAGRPLPTPEFYNTSTTLTDFERKNTSTKMYPGDYGCGNIPLIERLAPQSLSQSYPNTDYHPGLKFPDGKNIRQYTGASFTNPSFVAMLHEVDPSGVPPDWNESRDTMKNLIFTWIAREKALLPP